MLRARVSADVETDPPNAPDGVARMSQTTNVTRRSAARLRFGLTCSPMSVSGPRA